MRLEVGTFPVSRLELGAQTVWRDGTLIIDGADLRRFLLRDDRLVDVQFDVAHPGERTRIIHVLDVVEPRVKVAGAGQVFPGIVGPLDVVGTGRTHRLAGMAVLSTAVVPGYRETLDIWESMVDMAGPGADFTPFSQTANLVLSFRLAEPLNGVEGTRAIREATLRAAVHLAEATRQLEPPELTVSEFPRVDPALPNVVCITFLLGLSDLHTTFIYGAPVTSLPTLIHPNELADGAIVSANYHIAGLRNSTYHQQNHPIVEQLRRAHGRTINFAGLIVAQACISAANEKERSALQAAKLARLLGAEAAVLALESGGNAFTDLMLTCRHCERLGVKTVLVMPEYAGSDGAEPAFVDFVPEAQTIISTGNVDALVALPPVGRVIGGDDFPPSLTGSEPPIDVPPTAAFQTSLRRIQSATMGLGAWRLAGRAF